MSRIVVSSMFNRPIAALAFVAAAALSGCGAKPESTLPPTDPPTAEGRLKLSAELCQAGDASECENVAQQCAAAGDARCATTALTYACKQGSVASCEVLAAAIRKHASECATAEACIDSLDTAK